MMAATSRLLAGWMGPRSLPSRLRGRKRTQLRSASPPRTFQLYPRRPVSTQGNIRASLLHSQEVSSKIIENYIGITDGGSAFARFRAGAEAKGAAQAHAVRDRVQVMPGLSYLEIAALKRRIRILQERVGYTGDYDSWIASVTPGLTASQNFAPESMHQSLSSSAFHCGACR